MKKSFALSIRILLTALIAPIAAAQQLFPDVKIKGAPVVTAIENSANGGYFMTAQVNWINTSQSWILTEFNDNGSITSNFKPAVANKKIQEVHEMPDGKVLIGGMFNYVNGQNTGFLVRLNVDGTLDNTFSYFSMNFNYYALSFAVQQSGKIIVVGSFTSGSYTNIIRLNANGTVDNTFTVMPNLNYRKVLLDSNDNLFVYDESGVYKTDPNGNPLSGFPVNANLSSTVSGMERFGDKVMINGSFSSVGGIARSNFAVINEDGSIGSFSKTSTTSHGVFGVKNNGDLVNSEVSFVRIYYASGPVYSTPVLAGVIHKIFIDKLQRTIITGNNLTVNGVTQPGIIRLKDDFSLDESFNSEFTYTAGINAIISYPDGKILIGGIAAIKGIGSASSNLARINANGTIDASFNPQPTSENIISLALNGNKVVVCSKLLIKQLDASGNLDNSFTQRSLVQYFEFTHVKTYNTKIYVSGYFNSVSGKNSPGMIRLNSDGTIDNTFTSGLPQDAYVMDFAFQSDGKIIVVGPFGEGLDADVARINNNGSIDGTFTTQRKGGNGIYAVAVDSQDVIYLGGDFTDLGGINKFAKLSKNGVLDASFAPYLPIGSARIMSLTALSEDEIVVGANQDWYLNSLSGSPLDIFYTVNSSGAILSVPYDVFTTNSTVNAYYYANNTLYLAGRFTSNNNGIVSPIAKIGFPLILGNISGAAATRQSSSQIQISWNHNIQQATDFVVERSVHSSNSFMQLATVPDEQSVYIDENNIELGSTYYYRVKAINSVNESQYSPVAKVAPALQVTPATNIGAFSFTANWTSVDHSEGYKVEVSQDNFQTVLSETLSQETSVQVNGLNPLTNYQFRASYSDDGFYRVSDNVMTLQTLPIVLGNVSNLQATRTEPTVQLSWDDNTEYADEFVIERSENTNDSFESIATVPVGQVGFTDESILVLGNKYYYRLKAINSVSQSSYSNEVGVSQILKLDTPQAIDTMAFTATWNTVFDAETYKIEISQDDFNSILFENQTPNTSLRIEGLQPQLEYQYRVSFLQDGNYTLSLNTETAFTLPLSPVITSIHALSRYQIQLNWTNRFPEATTIQIFRSSASNGPYSQIKSLSASFTSYLDETLSGSQTYHYKLLASNNAISTLQSKSKSATTDPLLEQTITFSSIPNLTYSSEGVTKTLSASSTSGLPIEFISSNKKVATIEGNTLTATGVGEAIITAIQSGDSDYAEASAEQTLTVNQASQTITFNPPANFTFLENGDLGLQATASSGLAVVFESSNADIVSIINNKGIVKGAGTILITAIQAGDKNYKPASSQKQVIIDKANQTITFDPITSKTYGSGNFELIAISSSGLPVAFKSLNESVAIISDNKVSILSAGKVDIVASQPGNDNFNAAPNAYQTLTIEKAPQTISFNPIPNKTYGTPDFELQVSSTSGLPVIVISKNESIAILKDNKVSIQAIGEVELIATQSGNGNYYPAPSVSQIMLVSKAVQTITFDDLPAMKFGDPDFQVQAISSSGLPVFIKSLDESKLIVTGSTAKIVGAGKVSLLATQEGNGNYSPAEVRREETIDKADQTITFPTLSFIAIGDKSFDLIATSSSGLPVEFFSSDPNKISIKDNTATIGEVGSVTITASQAGNQNFNPASPVSQTFCVNPKKPIITVDENNGAVLLRSSNNTGNQWYLNGIAIDNARSNTLVVFEPGIYTVKTTAGQCSSEFSAEMPMVITGDFIDRPSEFRVHPNPSSSVFYVKQVSCIRNLEVTNSIGALLSGAIVTQEGEHWIIDLSGYPSGVYLLTSNGCPDVLRARLLKVN